MSLSYFTCYSCSTCSLWTCKENQSIARCTESTIATVSYESVEPYLYAPYHGGEVQTKYKTHVTYSFTVDEYTHS